MQIVLTRDLNPQKGYVKGAQFDWTRPAITAISQQLGEPGKPDTSWYDLSANIGRVAAAREKRGGRRPRNQPAPVLV